MSLTDRITRILLVAAIACLWFIDAKSQPEKRDSTIRGTAVYSDTGRPLRRASVTLYGEHGQVGGTFTDLRGNFVFANLAAGKYQVALEAPGLPTSQANVPQVDTLVPEPSYREPGELMTEVTVNGTDSVELKIKAVRGGVITGRVVTEDDEPLPNADIKLLRRENGKWVPVWSTWSSRGEKGGRITNGGGVYRIAGLPSGEYLVRAAEPSLPSDNIPGDEEAYSHGSFMVAYHPAVSATKDAQAVSVVAGKESTGIDIRMTERAPHTLTGTVKSPLLQAPNGDVEITVERSDEIGFATTQRNSTARVDPEGKWRVDGLPAGEYLVTFTGGALRMDENEGADFLRALTKRIVVRIPEEEKVTVLDTTLSLGAQVIGKARVNGKPPDENVAFTVIVGAADDATAATIERNEPGEPTFSVTSVSPAGEFTITALHPGNYWFMFDSSEDNSVYVKSVTRKGVDLMQAPFKLAAEEVFDNVVVTLATDLARIDGQVTLPDAAAKEPVGNLLVIMAAANEATRRFNTVTRTIEADARGKVVFKSGPGEYFIAALTAAEYEKLESEITTSWVEKNGDKFLRIKVRAGEKIKGLAVPMINK